MYSTVQLQSEMYNTVLLKYKLNLHWIVVFLTIIQYKIQLLINGCHLSKFTIYNKIKLILNNCLFNEIYYPAQT